MSDAELLLLVESQKKSAAAAALLNMYFPGFGYMYCGRWILGALVSIVVPLAIVTILRKWAIFALPMIWVFFALPLFIDGLLCAGRYNRKMIERVLAERSTARSQGFADGAGIQQPDAAGALRGFADA